MEHLIDYWKVCEYLGKEWDMYKVRITEKYQVTEKLVKFEPVPNKYQYDNSIVIKWWKYYTLKKYTTYLKEWILVYAYKAHAVDRHTDDMIYEYQIWKDYVIAWEIPFLSDEEVQKLLEKKEDLLAPHNDKISELKKLIKEEERKISDIEKEYSTDGKCFHEWELHHEEEDWKRTTREYYCTKCNKIDRQNWYSLF